MSLRDAEKYKKKKKKTYADTDSLPGDKEISYINADSNTPIDNELNRQFLETPGESFKLEDALSETESPDLFLNIQDAKAKDEYASLFDENKDGILISKHHKPEIFSDDINLEHFQHQLDICSKEVREIKESCGLTQIEVELIREDGYAKNKLLGAIVDKMKLDSL
jgi:hypothetical protein